MFFGHHSALFSKTDNSVHNVCVHSCSVFYGCLNISNSCLSRSVIVRKTLQFASHAVSKCILSRNCSAPGRRHKALSSAALKFKVCDSATLRSERKCQQSQSVQPYWIGCHVGLLCLPLRLRLASLPRWPAQTMLTSILPCSLSSPPNPPDIKRPLVHSKPGQSFGGSICWIVPNTKNHCARLHSWCNCHEHTVARKLFTTTAEIDTSLHYHSELRSVVLDCWSKELCTGYTCLFSEAPLQSPV